MAAQVDLENKLISPDHIAELALDDTALLQELLDGVAPQSQKSTRRENCFKALMYMAETWPEVLLPRWDNFVQLFKSNNGFSKYTAVYVIASLTKVDRSGMFEKNYEDYFALLDDESVMVASHAALNAAKIAQACPSLQTRILLSLLDIDRSHHNPSHLALVKAYIIETLDLLYPTSFIQTRMLEFVKAQQQSESPKTVKLAKMFIKKWNNK